MYVRKILAGRHAIGETVGGLGDIRRVIVGVVGDTVVGRSLRDPVPPAMYLPVAQSAGAGRPPDSGIRVSARLATSEGTSAMTRSIGTALAGVDRDLAFSFRPLADFVGSAVARERLVAVLSGFFGGLAVLLAAAGLYGVTAYAGAQRRKETAIRIALGAQRGQVVRQVLRRGMTLTAIGLVIGLGAAAAVTRYVQTLLFGVTPLDPATFVGVSLILLAVAALASYLPARRTTDVDPIVALRAE
jgi:ABC-type antimicrobial peptide transport system permease subunit